MWFTTTAWMMWNALVSSLLLRASIVMLDGNPLHPDLEMQWRLAERLRPTEMGAGPAYLMACRKAGVEPARAATSRSIRQLCAAGSPLPPEGYDWVYEQLGPQVLLNVGSGGTDVCTGIVQGGPLQPVYRGEISGPRSASTSPPTTPTGSAGHRRARRAGDPRADALDAARASGTTRTAARYRAAYFDDYPGVWRHGDWIIFTERGSCVIAGRSDATLNRGGVRLGTGEFYPVIEGSTEVPTVSSCTSRIADGGPAS